MNHLINWVNHCDNVPEFDKSVIEAWIEKVIRNHGKILGPLTYIFCDDKEILDVNVKFLSHDYYTDIITFDYTHGKRVSGDMFISIDTVATNAEQVGADFMTEFYRVIIHGVLHLCGINDKGPGEREIMEAHENEALSLLNL